MALIDNPSRNESGLVDAPGKRVVAPKGKYPHCAGYLPSSVCHARSGSR
jgi:hypothetical protein